MQGFVLALLLVAGAQGASIVKPPGQFSYASYYQSNMVLQTGVRVTVWGFHSDADLQVQLSVYDSSGASTNYTTLSKIAGNNVIWEVLLELPTEPGDSPFTITASSQGTDLTLNNVLFGDVWFCSGQSNMAHSLQNIDDAQPDIEDVVNYPNVRTFQAATRFSNEPQDDLMGIQRGWALPTEANIRGFSAICWLFGKQLHQRLNRPIGLIQSAWGGTRIETWMSPQALFDCFGENGPPAGSNQQAASALWNAMVNPFLKMPIFGAIWYQGESNNGRPADYLCSQAAMIEHWRSEWNAATSGESNPNFPFGVTQLAPYRNNDLATGYPDLRWAQTYDYGYCPNPSLTNTFIAVAADLPDFNSPHGSIHPRYKRQIAYRLALGAYAVGYNLVDATRFQGPFPTDISIQGNRVTITFDNGAATLDHRGTSGWELCCAPDASTTCPGTGASWVAATITGPDTSSVGLPDPCQSGQIITGARYIWRESPCALEACALYSQDNSLPVPPYIFSGAIKYL